MKEQEYQIHILTAIAVLLCAVLIGYNVFFAPTLPVINEVRTDQMVTSMQNSSDMTAKKVNLNTASLQELCTLEGIGEVTAKRIIAYREENGGFQSSEELMDVEGIGEKTFASIQDQITVK